MRWKIVFWVLCFLLMGSRAYAEETYIVKFNNETQLFENNAQHRSYCTATYEELCEYLDKGIVEYYEIDCEAELFEDYSATSGSESWNHDAINIRKAWDIGCYGNEVKVGVIDSGIYEHPDLKGNILAGHSYIDNSSDTTDNIGHGTYVAGIIAAECGIAYRAKIVPLKCFDIGKTTKASMIADAIYDAVDVYDCDVINMSFGMKKSLTNTTLRLSVAYALQNGCIVVAAVGNDGDGTEYYPARYDGVIGVGAIDENRDLSWFSQYNRTVDVVAPGEGIESVSVEGYDKDAGTSFAAPHVSAVAAIAKCIDGDLTAEEFNELIIDTSADLGDEGYDIYYGYGLIDAEKIVDKMLEDVKYFISPVAEGEVRLYNNTESETEAVGLVSCYEDGCLISTESYNVTLSPKKADVISFKNEGNLTKITLWDSMMNLNPLCSAREYILTN